MLFLITSALHIDATFAANEKGASDLGVDYAFMTLMTLSPDIAAANYTIENQTGIDVDISIVRFPYHIELMKTTESKLQLEIALAYQRTREVLPVFASADDYIDARWDTYGAGLGLLYDYNLSKQLRFTPSIRLGLASMENTATYHGFLADIIKEIYDGKTLNWETNASIVNLGLGLSYSWKLLDRNSSISADVHHAFIDSFAESDPAVSFSETANMLAVKADMIQPTGLTLSGDRLDFVVLLGANNYFGKNRNTLGYTTSYQAGIGAELPLRWGGSKYGYLRLSGQLLWASNMDGWLLTLGYSPK